VFVHRDLKATNVKAKLLFVGILRLLNWVFVGCG